jgi:hypothetical protein
LSSISNPNASQSMSSNVSSSQSRLSNNSGATPNRPDSYRKFDKNVQEMRSSLIAQCVNKQEQAISSSQPCKLWGWTDYWRCWRDCWWIIEWGGDGRKIRWWGRGGGRKRSHWRKKPRVILDYLPLLVALAKHPPRTPA